MAEMGITTLVTLEPMGQYLWEIQVMGPITGGNILKFTAKTANIPESVNEAVEINYKALKANWAGRDGSGHTYDLVFWDTAKSETYKFWYEWDKKILDKKTGKGADKKDYSGTVIITQLTRDGNVVATHKMKKTWVENLNAVSLDYSASDPTEITVSMRYDWKETEFGGGSSSLSGISNAGIPTSASSTA